mmetsp:Transcript_25982/g.68185  ORF Transcript_25982/g.68185 Transcript_25982/m.68185 type:complete len:87 (+) Transcript_25982:59-319(+)
MRACLYATDARGQTLTTTSALVDEASNILQTGCNSSLITWDRDFNFFEHMHDCGQVVRKVHERVNVESCLAEFGNIIGNVVSVNPS